MMDYTARFQFALGHFRPKFQTANSNRVVTHIKKASNQPRTDLIIGMEVLLSLSVLLGLLIHFTFYVVSSMISGRRNSAVKQSTIQGESSLEKSADSRGRPTRVFLPNVLARWPWPRRINPKYAVLKQEADTWITSFRAFSPKAQDAFNRCDFSMRLSSWPVRVLILFDRSPCLPSLSKSEQR